MVARLVAALAVTVSLFLARPAVACFDGYAATVGRAFFEQSMAREEAVWTVPLIRDLARWGTRIDAILPEGMRAMAMHSTVQVCRAESAEQCEDVAEETWQGGCPASAFWSVARLVKAPRAIVARALHREADVRTVQVFSAADAATARRVVDRMRDMPLEQSGSLEGFATVGGFPAQNDFAHVVEADVNGRRVYRVVVGAFLDEKGAATARHTLRTHGFGDAFVRAL